MIKTNCVILAAGDGKRMHAKSSKVLCEVACKPMLLWVRDAVRASGIQDICCVISNPDVERILENRNPVFWQTERLGTAHAVKTAEAFLQEHADGNTLILNGDAPFMDAETIKASLEAHLSAGASQTVISACIENPHGYGRIVRNPNGSVAAIVEELDCTEEQRKINEINSGASWYKTADLIDALGKIRNNNKKGEFYLTDTIAIFKGEGKRVDAFTALTSAVTLGANNPADLLALNEIAIKKIVDKHLQNGVHLISRDGIVIGPDVTIEPGATILPGTILKGNTHVGSFAVIGPNTVLSSVSVGDHAEVDSCRCSNCEIESNRKLGPFEQIHSGSAQT